MRLLFFLLGMLAGLGVLALVIALIRFGRSSAPKHPDLPPRLPPPPER